MSLDDVESAVGIALRQRGLIHRLLDDAVALAEGQRLEGGELAEGLPSSPFVSVVGVEKAEIFSESLTLRPQLAPPAEMPFPDAGGCVACGFQQMASVISSGGRPVCWAGNHTYGTPQRAGSRGRADDIHAQDVHAAANDVDCPGL